MSKATLTPDRISSCTSPNQGSPVTLLGNNFVGCSRLPNYSMLAHYSLYKALLCALIICKHLQPSPTSDFHVSEPRLRVRLTFIRKSAGRLFPASSRFANQNIDNASLTMASEETKPAENGAAPEKTTITSWADEPVDGSTLPGAQTDGAPVELQGSGLQEPEYDVQVKLSDLQADPNNPLFSVKSFEELGLYATWCHGI